MLATPTAAHGGSPLSKGEFWDSRQGKLEFFAEQELNRRRLYREALQMLGSTHFEGLKGWINMLVVRPLGLRCGRCYRYGVYSTLLWLCAELGWLRPACTHARRGGLLFTGTTAWFPSVDLSTSI